MVVPGACWHPVGSEAERAAGADSGDVTEPLPLGLRCPFLAALEPVSN